MSSAVSAIPDHIRPGLLVLFIGFNPSIRSGETGHHYANPNNRFWKIIHDAGLTPRRFAPEEDSELLELGYGFTNIVPRPTKTAAEITKEEYSLGRVELKRKLERFRPQVACYVGKGVYEQFSGRKSVEWGEQPESMVAGVTDFVAPSTSGLVRMRTDEMADIFRRLTELLNRRGE